MTVTTSTSQTETWLERRAQYVPRGVSVYHNIVADHAHGAEVWDVDGKHYIDFTGGIGTLNVGHTPERVVRAIADQAEKLIHMSFQVASYEGYIQVAERLSKLMPGETPKKTMLVSSGAEAVENAVKFARAATGRTGVISFTGGFHGRTLLALSLNGRERPYRAGFGPYAPDIYHARFPYRYRCPCGGNPEACEIETGQDLEHIFTTTVSPDRVAAILVEPLQGEGGFVVAPPEWLRKVRQICDREGILLIADEIQTGFGRTGHMWAVEHSGIEPDIMVVAKSLAAGLPLAAVVGKADVMDAPGPSGVGGTYGGNPVACAAALAVLDLFSELDLVERGRVVGRTIEARLRDMATRYPLIGEVRGLGAMQAIELVTDPVTKEPAQEQTSEIIHQCADQGLIIIKAGLYDNVVRILVPLTVEENLLQDGLDILDRVIGDVSA